MEEMEFSIKGSYFYISVVSFGKEKKIRHISIHSYVDTNFKCIYHKEYILSLFFYRYLLKY